MDVIGTHVRPNLVVGVEEAHASGHALGFGRTHIALLIKATQLISRPIMCDHTPAETAANARDKTTQITLPTYLLRVQCAN